MLLIIIKNNSIITRGKLAEYKTLDKKIQELEESDLTYYENNREEISKYLDLKKKYFYMQGCPSWPKGVDLRSSGVGLRGFKSHLLHFIIN